MTTIHNKYPFLEGGGEMGELTRRYNWAQTPLGGPDQWPQSLRTIISVVLNSKFPMFLWWGQDLIQFYNDAYRPSLGYNGKHPTALGQPGADCWPETWAVIKPLIDQVLYRREGTWSEDQLIPIERNGRLEDAYWTFSYSPVLDENNQVAGVLCTCTETTAKVSSLQQLSENRDQLEFAIEATELGTWDLNPVTNRFTANARLKEWFGLRSDEEIALPNAIKTIARHDRQKVSSAISRALRFESGGHYDVDYTIIHPVTRLERVVRAKGRAWFREDGTAYRFNGTLQDITAERKAQEEKNAARQLMELAIKSSGIGVFSIRVADGHMAYSPSFAAIVTGDAGKTGFTRNAFVAHIHPDDEPLRAAAEKEVLENGEFYYEPRMIWDDGSIHRIRLMGAALFNKAGKAILFSGTVQDITEEEKQKQALEEAEAAFVKERLEMNAKFRNVTNGSPAGLWLADETGAFTYVNQTFLDWTGMRFEDMLGNGWANAVTAEDRPRIVAAFHSAVSAGTHYDVQLQLKKKDGSVIWCQAAGHPFYDEHNRLAGYAGFCSDINEAIKTQKHLEELQNYLRSAIELAEVGTWSLDIATGVITCSELVQKWFGFTTGTIHWKDHLSLINRDDVTHIRKAIKRALDPASKVFYDVEFAITHAQSGQKRMLHVNGKTFFDAGGKALRLEGTMVDITIHREVQLALEYEVQQHTEELAAANEELQATNEELADANMRLTRSNEELAQYAYVASHDLQEPLRKIRIFSDILSNHQNLSADNRTVLEKINRSAQRMSMLIKDLLEFSRLLKSDTLIRPTSLNDLIVSITGDFELLIREKNITLEIGNLPIIEAVGLQMNQLFYNLMSNALKFSSPDRAPHIRIAASPMPLKEAAKYVQKPVSLCNYYHFTFEDNGIGFEPQYAEHIFEIFKRLHSRNAYPGSGIGLALCRRIVANHNGYMYATSELGKGTTFHIILPDRQLGG